MRRARVARGRAVVRVPTQRDMALLRLPRRYSHRSTSCRRQHPTQSRTGRIDDRQEGQGTLMSVLDARRPVWAGVNCGTDSASVARCKRDTRAAGRGRRTARRCRTPAHVARHSPGHRRSERLTGTRRVRQTRDVSALGTSLSHAHAARVARAMSVRLARRVA